MLLQTVSTNKTSSIGSLSSDSERYKRLLSREIFPESPQKSVSANEARLRLSKSPSMCYYSSSIGTQHKSFSFFFFFIHRFEKGQQSSRGVGKNKELGLGAELDGEKLIRQRYNNQDI
jgi:hypothetical protein